MFKLYCRTYQNILRVGSYIYSWRNPELLQGKNCLSKLPELVKKNNIKKVLIVTGNSALSFGLIDEFLYQLKQLEIEFFIYNKTMPNPTIDNIEQALNLYKQNKCEGIIAFGGGSQIDCAKGVGARVARPNKSISDLRGILKVRRKLPVLFAIPTTSGSGSEATIVAVITDSRTNEKYAITDPALIPDFAVLDPMLTISLPKHITSTTGMDALTHAIEAYIGRSNTKNTKELSKKSIKLIFGNLQEAYNNGDNLKARENMQKASYYAGAAFTRAYVGYVHAIAHALGGLYSIPHGLANAIILPHVLEYYGSSAHSQLAELADLVGISSKNDNKAGKSAKFIDSIRTLNKNMDLQEHIKGIENMDLNEIADRAYKEANPFYPVPRVLSKQDLANIIKRVE